MNIYANMNLSVGEPDKHLSWQKFKNILNLTIFIYKAIISWNM